MNPKIVLLTGGAGFIGSCLLRQLIFNDQLTVVNLDKLTYAGHRSSFAGVDQKLRIDGQVDRHQFIQGDICDRKLVGELLQKHQPSAILNLAAQSHVDRSIDGPDEFLQTNTAGTFDLLEVARHYWTGLSVKDQQNFRFLQVSTDEVYGSIRGEDKASEHFPFKPSSPYAASKAAGDLYVRSYFQTYDLPTITIHCSNNYGPRQFPEKLIPLMILNAFDGKPLPIYGDGENIRDWIHVEDHCNAIRKALAHASPGSVYNVGGNCEKSNLQVVMTISQIIDSILEAKRQSAFLERGPSSQRIDHVADRPGHDRRYAIDCRKIRTDLGWQPTKSFESGIADTVAWYLANPMWVSSIQHNRERRIGLGANKPS